MGKAFVIVIACMVMAGCSATARTGSLCTAGPIITDAGASTRWTENEQDQLTVLNESGEKICGWKTP